jgi:nucleotide-binding universal stress UspA family protein
MHGPSRILVPVDFSPCSREALEYGATLARHLGATVDVLHVWQAPFSEPLAGGLPPLAVFVKAEASRAMDDAIADLEESIGSCEHVRGRLASGDPTQVILDTIRSGGYDLVILGRHGHGRLHYLLMGSVAERVSRRAPVPVLTLHAPSIAPRDEPGHEPLPTAVQP